MNASLIITNGRWFGWRSDGLTQHEVIAATPFDPDRPDQASLVRVGDTIMLSWVRRPAGRYPTIEDDGNGTHLMVGVGASTREILTLVERPDDPVGWRPFNAGPPESAINLLREHATDPDPAAIRHKNALDEIRALARQSPTIDSAAILEVLERNRLTP